MSLKLVQLGTCPAVTIFTKMKCLFCLQCGLVMKCIGDKCDLVEENGKVVDMETDERGDFHFNALLDAVAEWRKQTETDCSLGGKESLGFRRA